VGLGGRARLSWLAAGGAGRAGSTVTIHLSFAPGPEYAQQLDAATGHRDHTVAQVLEAALLSTRNQCVGTGGKREPPALRESRGPATRAKREPTMVSRDSVFCRRGRASRRSPLAY
jgi:hypothetical protein